MSAARRGWPVGRRLWSLIRSAGLAATPYASHCTDDSPLFVATWYTLAAALVAAVGALVGSKVLRY
nr:NrsF family protein [Bradyrhizobium sp. CCBAU 11386]